MNRMSYNPSIYEINTRVFLKRFGPNARIDKIPDDYLDYLSQLKIDYVWFMGIWKTCPSSVEKYCFEEGLVRNYSRALKNWQKEDVIGSPFAVDLYEINETLGSPEDLINLKSQLNRRGIGLILDFIPNHFNVESNLLKTNPDIFLNVDKELFDRDPHTYFRTGAEGENYFAHGRDPFFPAWQDTVQVNFFSRPARDFLSDTVLNLTGICDGVRCDMAMLALNNVFKNTWTGVLARTNQSEIKEEFWSETIRKVKNARPDFLFIAEAYWDLEWELQQLGFDYTYDKSLTDRLRSDYVSVIKEHLLAEDEYQRKSIRFIENHDEERAVPSFGKEKSKAAAIIISTVQGMRFYNDGQFEGKKIKLPVQLGREPEETINPEFSDFYNRLLAITSHRVFKEGKWLLLEPGTSWEGNHSFLNILAWSWNLNEEGRLVVVNYSNMISTCRLKFDLIGFPEEFELRDLLNDQNYLRSAEEIHSAGLFIELKPWQAHIFKY